MLGRVTYDEQAKNSQSAAIEQAMQAYRNDSDDPGNSPTPREYLL
jgi:hypothetical protein